MSWYYVSIFTNTLLSWSGGGLSSDEDIDSSDQDDEVYEEHSGQKSKNRVHRKFSSKVL